MTIFLAGTGERAITPPLGCGMAGYFEPHYAEVIETDLFARAFAVSCGSPPPVAIVSCDVLALDSDTVARIRAKCASQADIPEANICVCATHAHTGPQTVDIFGHPADAPYLHYLESQAATAVVEAVRSARPSRLNLGCGMESGVSCNRRVIMRDGSVHTHTTGADAENEVGREGPVDHEMLALIAESDDGSPDRVLANFALHPTNIRGDRICHDYPGYLIEELRSTRGGALGGVFVNGACGDIDSKTSFLDETPYGPGRGRHIGAVLAQAVLTALRSAQPIEPGPVTAMSETIAIPRKFITPEQAALAERILARDPSQEIAPEHLIFTRGTRRPSTLKERVYASEALALAKLYAQSLTAPIEIQVFRIGGLALVAVPVELFSEFGLAIKQHGNQHFKRTMVAELANGYWGYVPSRRSFEGGGYETRAARSSQLAPEAGEMIVDAAGRLLDQIA